MTFGDPIIYNCPQCGKQMKMKTYKSYTVRRIEFFSDGVRTGRPHFTPDLAKCPNCKCLFFRHNVKNKKTMKSKNAGNIEGIEDPSRADLISALENNITENWEEEKHLRVDLWRSLNNTTRYGNEVLSGGELETWKANCDALLPLAERTLNEMGLKENSEKYDDDDRDNCIIQIAELYRNTGNFDGCLNLINELNGDWSWLIKQYQWECGAKNPFAFELLSKNDLNLEKNKRADEYDYFHRGKKYLAKYLGRRDVKKALADFNKAEELGMDGSTFYRERGLLYLNNLNDPGGAITNFSLALIQLEEYNERSGYHAHLLHCRSDAYWQKGNLAAALTDIQAAIEFDNENEELHAALRTIQDMQMNNEQ
jgi:tetratricopeptide (TPR) repeat protein